MISAKKPPARPLGEVQMESDNVDKLAASQRRHKSACEKKVELERRLAQTSDWISMLNQRMSDSSSLTLQERRMLDEDLVMAKRQNTNLEQEMSQLLVSIDSDVALIANLRDLIAKEEERNKKIAVWMISSLGEPRKSDTGEDSSAPKGPAPGEAITSKWDEEEPHEEEEEEIVDPSREEEAVVGLNNPEGICVDKTGSVYVTDVIRSCIRKITPKGKVCAVAGAENNPGYQDGESQTAQFRYPRGVTILGEDLIVCDTENHCLRRIGADGIVSTLVGTPGQAGFCDGAAEVSQFNMPWAVCVLNDGNALLVCDSQNHCIRRVSLQKSNAVDTIFGKPGEHGRGADELRCPWSICAKDSQVFVGDKFNKRLLMFDLRNTGSGWVLSDSWPETLRFGPRGLSVDNNGSIYMSHSWECTIWRLSANRETGELDQLDKIAGTGYPDHRDGKGDFSEFFCPAGLAMDLTGILYVADHANHCVRKCRELLPDDVKRMLAKFVKGMNNRFLRGYFLKWQSSVEENNVEPIEVVLALAMGTFPNHKASNKPSPLLLLDDSQVLRRVVRCVAASLHWRVVKTREEVAAVEQNDEVDTDRVTEAKAVFQQYDKDGGGTIDVSELLEALVAADMEVTEEEVNEMVAEFDSTKTGEIKFRDYCKMQGIELPDNYEEKEAERIEAESLEAKRLAAESTGVATQDQHSNRVKAESEEMKQTESEHANRDSEPGATASTQPPEASALETDEASAPETAGKHGSVDGEVAHSEENVHLNGPGDGNSDTKVSNALASDAEAAAEGGREVSVVAGEDPSGNAGTGLNIADQVEAEGVAAEVHVAAAGDFLGGVDAGKVEETAIGSEHVGSGMDLGEGTSEAEAGVSTEAPVDGTWGTISTGEASPQ